MNMVVGGPSVPEEGTGNEKREEEAVAQTKLGLVYAVVLLGEGNDCRV